MESLSTILKKRDYNNINIIMESLLHTGILKRKNIRRMNLWNCCCMLEIEKICPPLPMLLMLSVVNVLTQVTHVTTITTFVRSGTFVATDVAILVICLIFPTSHEVTTIVMIKIICLAANTTLVVINCLVNNNTHVVIN